MSRSRPIARKTTVRATAARVATTAAARKAPVDPLAQTKLDYTFNLIAGGVLKGKRHYHQLAGVDLVRELLQEGRTATISEATLVRCFDDVVARHGGRLRAPSAPRAPVADNLALLGTAAGLGSVDLTVLTFAAACQDRDMCDLLDPLFCQSRRTMVSIVAVATGRTIGEIADALAPRGRLIASGLLAVANEGDVDDRLQLDVRVSDLLPVPELTGDAVLARFVPRAPAPTLVAEDYAHLGASVDLAARVLAAAVAERRAGVNVLVYGPTGTGKTELARLLGARVAAPLYVAGREDERGGPPDARGRLASLLLGQRLLAARASLLLFDEMEDLFEASVLSLVSGARRDDGRMSKQWFNALLESNAVPTIWISNDVSGVDHAFLRRFSLVVEARALTASQRRRAWLHHLGGESQLARWEIDTLAHRFEVSPAQIGTAVATARLAAGARVDRSMLEAVLEPARKITDGGQPAGGAFEPARFAPEALSTAGVDLEEVASRLAAWSRARAGAATAAGRAGEGGGISLCLYGPPGTGKSAFVRYLAHRMDRPVLVRRASDLLSCWVGETEHNIAAAFEEARRDGSVLLLDEVDSFLRDRRGATRSWEVTPTNELLQQLEDSSGVVACTTNLFRELDPAALRRFTFKVAFRYLRPEQARLLFARVLAELAGEEGAGAGDAAAAPLAEAGAAAAARLGNLTPGDFAAVARRLRALDVPVTATLLAAELRAEVAVKEDPPGAIGFGR